MPDNADRIAMWARHAKAREVVKLAAQALGDVPIMPLKGVILGALGVVELSERPISDVDLLVTNITLRKATVRLRSAGFRVVDVAIAHGKLSLAVPLPGELTLDLHTTVMPTGLGRLTTAYMFAGASERRDLFDVPVQVPSLLKLALHTIGNIIKDRVVHALPHNASDLAALLGAMGPDGVVALARELEKLSLKRAGALAVTWAAAVCPSDPARGLLDRLQPKLEEQAALWDELARLQGADQWDLVSRILARAAADSAALRTSATIAAGADVVSWPMRHFWLRAAR